MGVVLSALIFISEYLLAITISLVVHEFGHYIVIRLLGLRGYRISFGSGRRLAALILKRQRLVIVIHAVPFINGCVMYMPFKSGEDEKVHQRIALLRFLYISAAGPIANLASLVLSIGMLCWLSPFDPRVGTLHIMLSVVLPGTPTEIARSGLFLFVLMSFGYVLQGVPGIGADGSNIRAALRALFAHRRLTP